MAEGGTEHRAAYLLERGIWRATCRACGWASSDKERARARSLFREHIVAERDRVVELRCFDLVMAEGDAPQELSDS